MEIGIHAAALVRPQQRIGGVERYVHELLRALFSLRDAQRHSFTLFAPEEPTADFAGMPNVAIRLVPAGISFTQLGLSKEFVRTKLDSFFVPAHILPRVLPGKTTVTVHGLEYEHAPWAYPRHQRLWLRFMTKDAVRRAATVIAVSQATRQDLLDRYRVPEQKIVVIPHGVRLSDGICATSDEIPLRERPYFLYFGRLEAKKNIEGIVRAFTTFKTLTRFPHKLFLAGTLGFGAGRIAQAIRQSPARKDIVCFGYIPEVARTELLRRADAFLFPSWAEGFGLPILEAQVQSVPVITSNTTAMPEVAGKAALFVDPADSEMLAQAMRKVVEDEKLRKNLIAQGLENVKRFSWEKAARETLRVLVADLE